MEEISLGKAIISGLEVDIKALKEKVKALQSKIDIAEQKRANYASYIAPLRRLPMDILDIIVDMCIRNGVRLATLTRICGYIRENMIARKSIWSDVHLLMEHSPRTNVLNFQESGESGIGCADRPTLHCP